MNTYGNTARRDLRAELDNAADEYPESWKPKPGDSIVGQVVRYTLADSPYGEKHICVLRAEPTETHGEYTAAVWLSHASLLREFKRLRPKPGERVGIKRQADRQRSGGHDTYAVYTVMVDRPVEALAPDWDSLEVGDE